MNKAEQIARKFRDLMESESFDIDFLEKEHEKGDKRNSDMMNRLMMIKQVMEAGSIVILTSELSIASVDPCDIPRMLFGIEQLKIELKEEAARQHKKLMDS